MNKDIYKLSPIVKDAIWGGKNIFKIEGNSSETVAELWEYVNVPQESNCIFGCDNTLKLSDVVEQSALPIVVKIINAKLDLSLQVHPDKSEVLLVLDASVDAKVVVGVNTDNIELFKTGSTDKVKKYLNYCSVKKGDIVYLPAGVVHAIGGGILALEVQNPNLTTYRLFDYNRKIDGVVRELHIDDALKSIKPERHVTLAEYNCKNNSVLSKVFSCEYYDIYVLNIEKSSVAFINPRLLVSVVCVAGEGKLGNIKIGFSDSFVCLPSDTPIPVISEDNLTLVFSTLHSEDDEIFLK